MLGVCIGNGCFPFEEVSGPQASWFVTGGLSKFVVENHFVGSTWKLVD